MTISGRRTIDLTDAEILLPGLSCCPVILAFKAAASAQGCCVVLLVKIELARAVFKPGTTDTRMDILTRK